ncbi:hypothetical protein FGO68_gene12274 [Halteria grandinella]|uniref:Uncharacterized protein n=1 Tax=Halteria grandinella TaxID=5974 RepID=A0A8J8T496_HALGN|nr:hypothetical protein FGO68_gene12274 [Halteria grandinella]
MGLTWRAYKKCDLEMIEWVTNNGNCSEDDLLQFAFQEFSKSIRYFVRLFKASFFMSAIIMGFWVLTCFAPGILIGLSNGDCDGICKAICCCICICIGDCLDESRRQREELRRQEKLTTMQPAEKFKQQREQKINNNLPLKMVYKNRELQETTQYVAIKPMQLKQQAKQFPLVFYVKDR